MNNGARSEDHKQTCLVFLFFLYTGLIVVLCVLYHVRVKWPLSVVDAVIRANITHLAETSSSKRQRATISGT